MSFHITEKVKNLVKGEARKKVQTPATLDERGREVLDPNPLFLDAGFQPEETQTQKIRRITMEVQREAAARLAAQNMTSEQVKRILDEEDDFEIPEDFQNTLTSYEAIGALVQLEDQNYLKVEPTTPEPVDKTIGDKPPEAEA